MRGFCAKNCGRRAVQLHHVVSQSRIKREHATLVAAHQRGGPKPWGKTKALKDERNLLSVCLRCHGDIESWGLRVEPSELPYGFWAFVEEYGLQGCLPRYLAEEEAA